MTRVPTPHGMNTNAKSTAARAFVRSLNILLKFARLYGFDHARTAAQFATAWSELRTALPEDSEAGLLLGAAGSRLLLDGVPLEGGFTEGSFAQLLSTAGLASIHFSPRVTREDLSCFARAFPTGGGTKPSAVGAQLKTALAGVKGIRINEVRFVAEDAATAEVRRAAQLTAQALGADAEQFKDWLNDPQKLLQLIVAAQGSKGGSADAGSGRTGTGGATPGAGAGPGGGGGLAMQGSAATDTFAAVLEPGAATSGAGISAPAAEQDILNIMRMLTQVGQASREKGAGFQPSMFEKQISNLPEPAQVTLRQALVGLAAQAPTDRPNEPILLKLAEHLAIRFALDRYERGEMRVNAVRQMMDRMSQEIDGLRKILGRHEEKMSRAGIYVESHADILDRQFWASVPESGKQAVLSSTEAWCIPPRNVRNYVEELIRRGEMETADAILVNYASCIHNADANARRRTAIGLSELADLYLSGESQPLIEAVRQTGAQVALEREMELQSLVSAAFVRLTQEAAMQRCYAGLQQALASLDAMENQRPASAQELRPRLGVESHLPEFIEEAVRVEEIPEGLAEVLRGMPRPSMDHLSARFNRSSHRKDCELLTAMAIQVGPDGASYLRETLRSGPAHEATEAVGLLSRLDPGAVEQLLPPRLRDWPKATHDRVVRQIAAAGSPQRGKLLLAAFDQVDPVLMSLAIDEIGMTGDPSSIPRLLSLAEGNLPEPKSLYLRLKAVEALGRLRATQAAEILQRIAEARQVWRWTHPSELRIAAIQALSKIDAEWTKNFMPRCGIEQGDFAMAPLDPVEGAPWFRQRRYPRVRLVRPIPATITTPKETLRVDIKGASLSGGLAALERHVPPGTQVTFKFSGLRGLRATVMMRDTRAQDVAFEIVDMDLEERAKLRRLLLAQISPSAAAMEQGVEGRRAGHNQPSAR